LADWRIQKLQIAALKNLVYIGYFVIFFISCKGNLKNINRLSEPQKIVQQDSISIILAAYSCLYYLESGAYDSLAKMVHPESGLRIVPMVNCTPSNPLFGALKLKSIWDSDSSIFWGIADGSGDSIVLTFENYKKKFLQNRDYKSATPEITNKPFHFTNTRQNIQEFFPKSNLVDFTVNPKEDMDWGSLIFVFKIYEGQWKLVGILSNYWTI